MDGKTVEEFVRTMFERIRDLADLFQHRNDSRGRALVAIIVFEALLREAIRATGGTEPDESKMRHVAGAFVGAFREHYGLGRWVN